ncbi:hypothetical protein AAG570_013959, partial [Ranatra chinensis]
PVLVSGGCLKFTCGRCGKSYKYRSNLRRHEKFECGQERQFKCHLCAYAATQKVRLVTHLISKRVFPMFSCRTCGKSYKYKKNLTKHERYECGDVRHFRCHVCDYAAKQKVQLITHFVSKHKEGLARLFGCKRCGRSYKHRSSLSKHERYECGGIKLFKCSFCHYSASQKIRLHCYMSLLPAGREKCPRCGKGYKYRFNLYRHMRYECGGLRHFACLLCDYSAKRKATLQRHTFLKHNEWGRFSCETCGKGYKYRHNMLRHKRYECGGQRRFKCPACDYAASYKDQLRMHFVAKHGDFRCEACGKYYKYKYNLNKHRRYECGGARPFRCSVCSYAANQKVSLINHMITRHKATKLRRATCAASVGAATRGRPTSSDTRSSSAASSPSSSAPIATTGPDTRSTSRATS